MNSARKLPPLSLSIATSTSGSSAGASLDSRSGSFGEVANGLNSSQLFINPISAVSTSGSGGSPAGSAMERETSVGPLPDLAKLKIDLGRDIDVEDLDDAGWKAASKEGMIQELGSLGEGAGGAVTRCVLTDGKTVFALKVCHMMISMFRNVANIRGRS
jgi:mitogen-activated protein kinase kinase